MLEERCRQCKYAFAEVKMCCGSGHHIYASTGQCSVGYGFNRPGAEFTSIPAIICGLEVELARYHQQHKALSKKGVFNVVIQSKIDTLERALSILKEL